MTIQNDDNDEEQQWQQKTAVSPSNTTTTTEMGENFDAAEGVNNSTNVGVEQPIVDCDSPVVDPDEAELNADKDPAADNNVPVPLVINEWAQGTSIHGVPYVTDAQQWKLWKRLTWIFLVLISTAFMIWQITELISQYKKYDVITDTHTEYPVSLPFPEITVCSSNVHSRSRREAKGIAAPQNEQELFEISQPFEDFIRNTWFNGKLLNSSEFWTPVLVAELGRCWVFKTNDRVRRPGYQGGLQVHLVLEQEDFEPNMQYAAAFFWALQPGSQVSVHNTPVGARPGKETFVGLELTQYEREPVAPWARCFSEAPQYTQYKCRDDCVFTYLREECQCRFPQDTVDMSLPLCDPYGRNEECMQQSVEVEQEILESCDCDKPPCFEQIYDSVIHEVDPSQANIDHWAETNNVTEEYVLKNYIGLRINFRNLQYSKLTESRGMTFPQLLGGMGGSMGFFLGISLVSIFELFGDLVGMRLIPRLFGRKQLYGVGAHYKMD